MALVSQLEALTVTVQEQWAGLLADVEVDVNRKLLALQVRWAGYGAKAKALGATSGGLQTF